MAKQFTLGKNERLKSRKQIERLFREGKTISTFPFHIYYLLSSPGANQQPLQFGIAVSGKNFKRAVDRNRIKRLAREAYRVQKNELERAATVNKQHLNLFFIYTGKELPGYKFIYDKMAIALQRIIVALEK